MIDVDKINESIEHWNMLADTEDCMIRDGVSMCHQASRARAELYRRTAKALRIERDTGDPVCVCCHKRTGARSVYAAKVAP